jgi:glycosyltransferase involved in cell wall biosynthesis
MKALIIHCTYKVKGGEDTVVEEEIKLLQSFGITVNLLLFDNSKNSLLKFLLSPFNIFSYIKTKRKIRQFKPDVVHIHNLHYAASASVIYAVKKFRIPIVITLHNYRLICPSGILFFNDKPFFNSLHQKFPWSAVRKGVYRNSVILTFWLSISMQLHRLLGTWNYCERFIVLSNNAKEVFMHSSFGVNKKKFVIKSNFFAANIKPSYKKNDYFLYAGRLNEEKGIKILLKAFAHSSFRLKIAGQGPLEDKVINYCSHFPNLEFKGSLQKKNVLELMQNCTALVFPSIWLEGMPLTIIEAFACGMPVISSRTGVMSDMITDRYNGILFEPGNENDLLKALHYWDALTEFEKKVYSKNARKTYELNYSPAINAKQLLSIYDEVTHNKTVTEKIAV